MCCNFQKHLCLEHRHFATLAQRVADHPINGDRTYLPRFFLANAEVTMFLGVIFSIQTHTQTEDLILPRWTQPGEMVSRWVDRLAAGRHWMARLGADFTKNVSMSWPTKKSLPRKKPLYQTVGMQNSVKQKIWSKSGNAASTSRTVPKVGTAPHLAQSASCGADTNATNSARWLMDSVDAWFKIDC